MVTIITNIKKNNDKIPQKTDPKKIVDKINKKTSRLVILLKNKGLERNWSITKMKLMISSPVKKPLL